LEESGGVLENGFRKRDQQPQYICENRYYFKRESADLIFVAKLCPFGLLLTVARGYIEAQG
jgi:hypothetical protein